MNSYGTFLGLKGNPIPIVSVVEQQYLPQTYHSLLLLGRGISPCKEFPRSTVEQRQRDTSLHQGDATRQCEAENFNHIDCKPKEDIGGTRRARSMNTSLNVSGQDPSPSRHTEVTSSV